MEKKKSSKKWIFVVVALLLIYPIYFCVVQICTQTDSLSLFPTEGVWLAEADGFSIEIDLDAESPAVTLSTESGDVISLELAESGGHGTILYPTAASSILYFESESLELTDENYVFFSSSKFKFNETDFYIRNICTHAANNLSIIQNNTSLHFVRQDV